MDEYRKNDGKVNEWWLIRWISEWIIKFEKEKRGNKNDRGAY